MQSINEYNFDLLYIGKEMIMRLYIDDNAFVYRQKKKAQEIIALTIYNVHSMIVYNSVANMPKPGNSKCHITRKCSIGHSLKWKVDGVGTHASPWEIG